MQKIKKIGVISLAYNLALVYFFIGIIVSLVTLVAINIPVIKNALAITNPTLLSAAPSDIIYIIFGYTAGGFLVGLLVALIYNMISKWTGGISLTLSSTEDKDKKIKK